MRAIKGVVVVLLLVCATSAQLSEENITAENHRKLRRLTTLIGYRYGSAVTMFLLARRDGNKADMGLACESLRKVDELVRGGTQLVDRAYIETLEGMEQVRLGCAAMAAH